MAKAILYPLAREHIVIPFTARALLNAQRRSRCLFVPASILHGIHLYAHSRNRDVLAAFRATMGAANAALARGNPRLANGEATIALESRAGGD